MGWKGNDWETHADRFDLPISYDWKVCCWFDSATSMILARTFLQNNGHAYQESYDNAMEAHVLLTNYDPSNMAVSA